MYLRQNQYNWDNAVWSASQILLRLVALYKFDWLIDWLVGWLVYWCVAPVIVVAPEDQKVAQSGIANFYCQATGSPTPSVEWRKSGQRIGRHHKRYLIVDASDGSVVLRIEPVRARRDEDSYECRADNGVGTPAVARARLNVYPDEQSGQKLQLSCLCSSLSSSLLVVCSCPGPKNPLLCPRGRVALSCGRVAHGGRTNASCGPFAQWPERYHDCEQWRIHRGEGGGRWGWSPPPPEWKWSLEFFW